MFYLLLQPKLRRSLYRPSGVSLFTSLLLPFCNVHKRAKTKSLNRGSYFPPQPPHYPSRCPSRRHFVTNRYAPIPITKPTKAKRADETIKQQNKPNTCMYMCVPAMACSVTTRGEKAEEILNKGLQVKEFELKVRFVFFVYLFCCGVRACSSQKSYRGCRSGVVVVAVAVVRMY